MRDQLICDTGIIGRLVTGGAAALLICLQVPSESLAQFRFEGGGGIAHGDHDVSFSEDVAGVDLRFGSESALNGAGWVASAAFWADSIVWGNFSAGVQYLHTRNSGDMDIGATARREDVNIDSDLSLSANFALLKAAFRQNSGKHHPSAGIGVGAAWWEGEIEGKLETSLRNENVHIGEITGDGVAPALTAFAGYDYDVNEWGYLGFSVEYIVAGGNIFGSDDALRQLAAMAKVGFSF